MKLASAMVLIVLVLGGSTLLTKGCSVRLPGPPRITVDSIVAALEPLRDLTTLRTNVNGVVSGEQEGAYFWQGSSRMVLLVNGSALYGIDLERAEVEADAEHVSVTLPEPELTAVWVDMERTRVWERSTGRFMDGGDTELETAVWRAAQGMVEETALKADHTEEARAQTERVVRDLVEQLAPGVTISVAWGAA